MEYTVVGKLNSVPSVVVETEITAPELIIDAVTAVSCGASDGAVTVGVTGGQTPYNFNWNNGQGNSQNIQGLGVNNYVLTVTGNNGCASFIDANVELNHLQKSLSRLFEISSQKIALLRNNWDEGQGSPVFTVNGKYSSRAWTEWTQGFMYGNALLIYEVT